MTATDPALTALAQSWCALSLLHGRIETHVERALQSGHGSAPASTPCWTSSAGSTTVRAAICR